MAEPQDAPPIQAPDPLAEARRLLHEQKKPAEALPLLEGLLKRDPDNAAALAEQAAALADLARLFPAGKAAARALELDPSLDLPRAVLASVALRQGRFDAAEAALRERLAVLPAEDTATRARVHNQIGGLYFRRHRYDEAAEALDQALELAPDAPMMRYNLAMLHRRARRWDDAALELQRVVETPAVPADIAYLAHVNLGHLRARAGRYGEARAQFERALGVRSSLLARFYRAVPFLARFTPSTLLIVLMILLFVASYAIYILR